MSALKEREKGYVFNYTIFRIMHVIRNIGNIKSSFLNLLLIKAAELKILVQRPLYNTYVYVTYIFSIFSFTNARFITMTV